MKSIKILLPSALTFMMFLGTNQAFTQSSFNDPINNSILSLTKIDGLNKSVGLYYKQTLIDINNKIETIKADQGIDFRGRIMIHLNVDTTGNIASIRFNQEVPENLSQIIRTTLATSDVTPVLLNGKAKTQSFKIPVLIK